MKVEIGDYIEHTWDEHYGVVIRVNREPFNMGETYVALNTLGLPEVVTEGNFVADFGTKKSDHHRWAEGEQAEYGSLSGRGRTLYDQIRTRLDLDHATAYLYALDAEGKK